MTFKTGTVNINSNSSLQVTGDVDNQRSVMTLVVASSDLIVGGDFTQEVYGTSSMQISSSGGGVGSFSFVMASGTANLSGTLIVSGTQSAGFTADIFQAAGGGGAASFSSESFPPATPPRVLVVDEFVTNPSIFSLNY